jgi:hypothetical protein
MKPGDADLPRTSKGGSTAASGRYLRFSASLYWTKLARGSAKILSNLKEFITTFAQESCSASAGIRKCRFCHRNSLLRCSAHAREQSKVFPTPQNQVLTHDYQLVEPVTSSTHCAAAVALVGLWAGLSWDVQPLRAIPGDELAVR